MNCPGFFTLSVKSDNETVSQKAASLCCGLCPRRCVLAAGKIGACRVRLNNAGEPALPFSGYITAIALDPIEKKPLYHFRPGTEILSVGFTGCNLHCPFCQNWHISQNTDVPGRFCSPAEIIAESRLNDTGIKSIAYTYSEPLIHMEFLLDCMKEARKAGIANVLVTNGCINPEAAAEILDLTDAANIDLKCFSEETYANVLGGNLPAVLLFIRMAIERGVHVELTTLVVPSLNDSEEELDACIDFIAGLGSGNAAGKPGVPWHLSAYHPGWKWKAPPTSPELLALTAARAKKRLAFVYQGNVAGEKNDTLCPFCGKTLISRRGYRVDTPGLLLKKGEAPAYFCASCGEKAPVKY